MSSRCAAGDEWNHKLGTRSSRVKRCPGTHTEPCRRNHRQPPPCKKYKTGDPGLSPLPTPPPRSCRSPPNHHTFCRHSACTGTNCARHERQQNVKYATRRLCSFSLSLSLSGCHSPFHPCTEASRKTREFWCVWRKKKSRCDNFTYRQLAFCTLAPGARNWKSEKGDEMDT